MLVLKVCLTFAQTHVICVICALCLCYKCSLLAMARRFAADNLKIFVPSKRTDIIFAATSATDGRVIFLLTA